MMWEVSQWRNQDLINAQLEHYGQLTPMMINDAMYYLSFVGHWKQPTHR